MILRGYASAVTQYTTNFNLEHRLYTSRLAPAETKQAYIAVHQACIMANCQVLDKPSVDAIAGNQEVYQVPGKLPIMACGLNAG